jgi:hypothetical protein
MKMAKFLTVLNTPQKCATKLTPGLVLNHTACSIHRTSSQGVEQFSAKPSLSRRISCQSRTPAKYPCLQNPRPVIHQNACLHSVAVLLTEQVDNLISTSKKRSSSKSKKQKRWREYTDPSTGKNYYSNGTTTTWSKPCLEGVAETPTPNIDAPKAETSDPTTIDNDQTAKTEVLDKSEKAGPKSKSARLLLIPKFKSRKEKEKVCHAEDTSVGTDNNTADTEGNVSIVSSPEYSVTATNSSPTENTTPLDESVEAPKDVVRRLFV